MVWVVYRLYTAIIWLLYGSELEQAQRGHSCTRMSMEQQEEDECALAGLGNDAEQRRCCLDSGTLGRGRLLVRRAVQSIRGAATDGRRCRGQRRKRAVPHGHAGAWRCRAPDRCRRDGGDVAVMIKMVRTTVRTRRPRGHSGGASMSSPRPLSERRRDAAAVMAKARPTARTRRPSRPF